MIELIDSIQNPVLRAFFLRFYNNFIGFIAPALIAAILLFISTQPEPFLLSYLFTWSALDFILGATLLTVLGSAITGLAKAKRVVLPTATVAASEDKSLEG